VPYNYVTILKHILFTHSLTHSLTHTHTLTFFQPISVLPNELSTSTRAFSSTWKAWVKESTFIPYQKHTYIHNESIRKNGDAMNVIVIVCVRLQQYIHIRIHTTHTHIHTQHIQTHIHINIHIHIYIRNTYMLPLVYTSCMCLIAIEGLALLLYSM